MHLSDWGKYRTKICERIADENSLMKIVIKTKDDSHLLERWINHHRAIVGDKGIIVFDNMSSRPGVFEIYSKYPDILVVQYDGFCDIIHLQTVFKDLYEALRRSCNWYAFIDTDEFLVKISAEGYSFGNDIVDYISCHLTTNFFAAP